MSQDTLPSSVLETFNRNEDHEVAVLELVELHEP